jgi:hypothetical protein
LQPPTLFHITHYKAGSQWIYVVLRELFPDRIVHPLSKVAHVTNPEAGKIYPTVYLPKASFSALQLPENSKCFFVLRDLRDTHISLYFSMLKSHPIEAVTGKFNEIASRRRRLNSLDLEQGLSYTIPFIQRSAEIQQSWYGSNILTLRYEDFLRDEFGCFQKILTYAGLEVDQERFASVVRHNSFSSITGRQRGDEDQASHFRKGVAGDWRNYYSETMKEKFKQAYGQLLIETGYEQNHDW